MEVMGSGDDDNMVFFFVINRFLLKNELNKMEKWCFFIKFLIIKRCYFFILFGLFFDGGLFVMEGRVVLLLFLFFVVFIVGEFYVFEFCF